MRPGLFSGTDKGGIVKIIIGISGATGVQMGARLLEVLKSMPEVETHLIVSKGAKLTFEKEANQPLEEVINLADYSYDDSELSACISSGSFRTDGMIVIPCSMKSLSGIANGYAENLLQRAADVCLKESRKVVLVPREMPLGKIHLRNMLTCAELGCSIIPPMLTFYSDYPTAEDQIDHVIGKVLMQFGIEYDRMKPWDGR